MFGLDCNVRNRMIELGRSPLYAIIKSQAGDYYYAGLETSGRASAGDANLGTLLSDMNGVSLTIQWKSGNGVFLLDPAVLGTDITIL